MMENHEPISSTEIHEEMASSSSTTATTTSTTDNRLAQSTPSTSLSHSKAHWKRMLDNLLKKAEIVLNGPNEWDPQIYNDAFYKRVMVEGSLGLGESYMDGWWDCKRLDIMFTKIFREGIELPKNLNDIFRIAVYSVFNLQTKIGALKVAKEHYDLGNDLFEGMLDPNMQYSCGYWKDAKNLNEAQEAKLKLICDKLCMKPGMTLLDIGCGWGGLACYAAKNYGVSVTGITISKEQQIYAQERCKDLPVEIKLVDYRDPLNKKFDRVVSVGMLEHVGSRNYKIYFETARKNITDDGIFLVHTIGNRKPVTHTDAWIAKYIFPHGCLPSISGLASVFEDHFIVEDLHNIGQDYDPTLMAWYENFIAIYPSLDHNIYNERFKRMWTFYLKACAGCFRSRDLQLWQFVLTPKGYEGGLRVPR
ncbi:hypothetical protein CYY_005533 [Polysphondylium violaceum]|uniref:Cyclopropane fatty acyl phospholipid synthase n=1 Tax=Polysphondylium violaceum TaxID=133409 RepID=A0A8J4PUX0_9MYCE|nr:hypothetical protein CYY_005533 [Polysphondylium violaceum]